MQLLHRVLADVQLMLRRPPRLQYAALCYRVRTGHPLEILLITSRDTGRWVIPKGWPMKGKRAHEVAAREAFEEAGVKGSCERAPIGHYVYRKKLDSGLKVSCKVHVFAMKVAGLRGNFPEKGERKLVWFEYRQAARRVAERSRGLTRPATAYRLGPQVDARGRAMALDLPLRQTARLVFPTP